DSEWHQDPAQAARPGGRGAGCARAPLAAQLRARVEAGRGGYRGPDAAAGLVVRGHAPSLRRQRRRRACDGDPATPRERGTTLAHLRSAAAVIARWTVGVLVSNATWALAGRSNGSRR